MSTYQKHSHVNFSLALTFFSGKEDDGIDADDDDEGDDDDDDIGNAKMIVWTSSYVKE